jgi:hypothetical protein
MKRVITTACALALVLSGCATPRPIIWTKPGATDEQFRRDQMNCRQYGMQSATASGMAGNMFVELWITGEAFKCLEGLGYSR